MKKILSIALIAALVVSSVFAVSFTGSAALELGYDLDSKDYGFNNAAKTELKFGFELGSGDGAAAGEKDLRAEIAGTFKVEFAETKYTSKGNEVTANVTTLKISKANILYKDILTIGILNAGSSADYASSYNVDKDKKTLSNVVTPVEGVAGFTFKLNQYGVNGGFGLKGKADDSKYYSVLAHAELADKELAEGLKLSIGAGALLTGTSEGGQNTIQANVKGSYEKDLFSASAAVDFATILVKDADARILLEAAAAAKYDFVNLNVYFYSVDKFENAILDAKIAAKKTFGEDVKITVDGSFEANNVADKTRAEVDKTSVNGGKQEFTPAVNATAEVDAFTFGAGVSYGIKAKKLALNASVKYAPEEFTAEVKVGYSKTIEAEKTSALTLEASISSTKVIDGATLALKYAGCKNLLKDQETAQKLGNITASATVKF